MQLSKLTGDPSLYEKYAKYLSPNDAYNNETFEMFECWCSFDGFVKDLSTVDEYMYEVFECWCLFDALSSSAPQMINKSM